MKLSGTIPPDQYEWIKKEIKSGRFYNKSHMIQEGIKVLQEREKSK